MGPRERRARTYFLRGRVASRGSAALPARRQPLVSRCLSLQTAHAAVCGRRDGPALGCQRGGTEPQQRAEIALIDFVVRGNNDEKSRRVLAESAGLRSQLTACTSQNAVLLAEILFHKKAKDI